jgi:hypothetical protein
MSLLVAGTGLMSSVESTVAPLLGVRLRAVGRSADAVADAIRRERR